MSGPILSTTRRPIHGGFTLIELTVVLAVIVTLALILTPSIANFITDSRMARAQFDCQTLGSAVVQFYRDNGFFPQWASSPTGGGGLPQMRLQLLVTAGNTPLEEQTSPWTTGTSGFMSDQLLVNGPGYALRTATSQFGWNGPYLSSPEVRSDPWGNRYAVNVGLIDNSAGVQSSSGQIKAAVWVLSAGPDGTIQTPFVQPVTSAAKSGDDVVFRIQ